MDLDSDHVAGENPWIQTHGCRTHDTYMDACSIEAFRKYLGQNPNPETEPRPAKQRWPQIPNHAKALPYHILLAYNGEVVGCPVDSDWYIRKEAPAEQEMRIMEVAPLYIQHDVS